MAKKDLAALAGLAGLAYMLNRDKPEQETKGRQSLGAGYDSTETRLESPQETIARSMAKAPGESSSEIQATMPEKAAAPAAKLSSKPAVSSAPSIVSVEEGMKNYKPRRTPPPPANTVSSSAEGMSNYKPRRTPAAAPFKGGQPGYDEAGNFLGGRRGYDEAGNPMKKGGKVKKMASGGMTASRRADGIASRGKTKCKMY